MNISVEKIELKSQNGTSIDLYNGDSLNVLQSIADNTIDLIVTSPPYNLGNHMLETIV